MFYKYSEFALSVLYGCYFVAAASLILSLVKRARFWAKKSQIDGVKQGENEKKGA